MRGKNTRAEGNGKSVVRDRRKLRKREGGGKLEESGEKERGGEKERTDNGGGQGYEVVGERNEGYESRRRGTGVRVEMVAAPWEHENDKKKYGGSHGQLSLFLVSHAFSTAFPPHFHPVYER